MLCRNTTVTILDESRAVERALAGFRLRPPHITANDAQTEVRRIASQAVELSFAAFKKRGLLDQIAGRVTGEGELGKNHDFGAASRRLARGAGHAVDIPGQVADRGIQLRQSDAHGNSIVTVRDNQEVIICKIVDLAVW